MNIPSIIALSLVAVTILASLADTVLARKSGLHIVPANLPVSTFIFRYWFLLLVTAGAIYLSTVPSILEAYGTIVFAPAAVFSAVVLNLLVTHLWFRGSIDADTQNGKYLSDWHAMEPHQRVYAALFVRGFVFIGTAIVVACLVK